MRLRNILGAIVAVLVVALLPPVAGAQTDDTGGPVTMVRESGVTVVVQDAGDVVVHSLVAPESVFANTTHIIETAEALVMYDAQFLLPFAADVRAYADSLGKPVEAMLITHAHPDHFLGSEVFADLPIFALAGVVEDIAEHGDAEVAEKQAQFGPDLIASSYVVPEVLEPGTASLGGVEFDFSEVLDAEAHVQLVTRIPSAGVVVTGDIIYSGVHLIFAGPADTWTVAIDSLVADQDDYPVVLPGHGVPTDPSVYDANKQWLATAAGLSQTAANGAEFKQALIDAFPDLGMADAIDFVLPIFFPEDMAEEEAATAEPAARADRFSTHLFGRDQSPAADSSGFGWSTWQVDGDELHFRLVLAQLEGTVVAAHLHQAMEGRNGPVVAGLDISSTSTLDGSTAQVITGTISTADFSADLEGRSMAALVGAIEHDSIYINVHTDTHPNGEIRGQLS